MRSSKKHSSRMLLTSLVALVMGMGTGAHGAFPPQERTLMERAHRSAANNKHFFALKLLRKIKAGQKQIPAEVYLLEARIYYNMKKFDKSLKAYSQIDKKSEHWITAVEERAWVKVQMGKMNEAIADSHTLMSPLFELATSPEAYFLSAYVAHQVCDFTRVFQVIDKFKKTSGAKIKSIERDLTLKNDAKKQWELRHYADVIKHLHLIEADAIQRLYLDQKLKGKRFQAGSAPVIGKYDLQFPFEENDVWIDEIDQLKVDAKNCPTLLHKKVVSL